MLQFLLKLWIRIARRLWKGQVHFNFASRFAGLTNGQISRGIASWQRDCLKEFFGSGVEGAEATLRNFKIPEGMARETLERYHEIARRQIKRGLDPLGVQRLRLRLVERALREMDRLGR